MHHDHGVGKGQRLGLVMGDIDHRQIELAMQRLQFRAQLPFQFGIDHRQRLVKQNRGDVGAHQAAAERNLLLGVGRQPRRLAVHIGRQIEQLCDLGDTGVDLGLRHATILQGECEVLADRHGVVDDRELEHLRDVALLRGLARDVLAVKGDAAVRRRDEARDDVEHRGLAAAALADDA